MQADLARMQQLLAAVPYHGAQHTHARLQETDPQARVRAVTVEMGTGDWFVFTPDAARKRERRVTPLLACRKGHWHHCLCDAVLVSLAAGYLYLIYIELKSDRPTHYEQQFRSTACFMAYWREVARSCYEIAVPEVRQRYLVLCRQASRQPTRIRIPDDPSDPWQITVDDGGRLHRNQLPLV